MAIYRDTQLALALKLLEENEVQNMEKKEQMIMRDGDFAIMIQQKEEDQAQKLVDIEQQAMSSISTGKDLVLVQRFPSLHHFIKYSILQNLGVPSKVTTLAMDSIFSLQIFYSIYKQYLEFPGKCHCGRRVALHKLAIYRDDLHQ